MSQWIRPRRFAALGVVLIATAVLAGATGASVTNQATVEQGSVGTIQLGVITSLSGVLSVFGLPTARGVSLAASAANKGGGFTVKGKRYKFSVKVLDDRSNPQTAVAAATQLVRDDRVKFTFGPLGQLAIQVVQLTQSLGTINFNGAISVTQLAGTPRYPLVFSTAVPDGIKVAGIIRSLKTFLPRARRIAIVSGNDAVAQTFGKTLSTRLTRNGYTVNTFLYPPGSTDVSVTMTNVAAFRPDFIFTGNTFPDTLTQVRAMDGAGIPKSVGFNTFGGAFAAARDLAAPLSRGRPMVAMPFIEADFGVPGASKGAQNLLKRYLKLTGQKTPDPQAALAQLVYNGVPLLVAAMKKAGTVTDTSAIARALKTVTAQGIIGPVRFNKSAKLISGMDYTFIPVNGRVRTLHYP